MEEEIEYIKDVTQKDVEEFKKHLSKTELKHNPLLDMTIKEYSKKKKNEHL